MPLKPLILSPLPNLLQEHPPPPLFKRILADNRRPLDRTLRVWHRRGTLRLVQIVAHEYGTRAAIAVDVGAAGREWRRNLGQEFALVMLVGGCLLLMRVVKRRGEHCSCDGGIEFCALDGGEFRMEDGVTLMVFGERVFLRRSLRATRGRRVS